jgi:NitT/TauT family transport system permease protein
MRITPRKIFVMAAVLSAPAFALAGVGPDNLLSYIAASSLRMIVGFLISAMAGLGFSILIGFSKYARMAFKPVLGFLMSIPTIAWVPMLLVITGITEKTIILSIFLGSFFTFVYNALDGFDTVDPVLFKVSDMLGYGRVEGMFKVSIPASFNSLLAGFKLSIAYSWRALVSAEMLGATTVGLGYLVFAARSTYNMESMLLALFYIGTLGYILNRLLVRFLEDRTVAKWGLR